MHTHTTDKGRVVKCYHECKNLLKSYSFWIGVTISFPIEHLVWNVWPLNIVAKWFGV